jgi:hypothetical protein
MRTVRVLLWAKEYRSIKIVWMGIEACIPQTHREVGGGSPPQTSPHSAQSHWSTCDRLYTVAAPRTAFIWTAVKRNSNSGLAVSSWLQIQRSGFDSRRYHGKVLCLERGSLSLVSSTEEDREPKILGGNLNCSVQETLNIWRRKKCYMFLQHLQNEGVLL